jgi:hypothetical protein
MFGMDLPSTCFDVGWCCCINRKRQGTEEPTPTDVEMNSGGVNHMS